MQPNKHAGKKRIDVFSNYDEFVAKFEVKKTTDECYTPAAVYDAVVDYVDEHITPLEGRRIVRPFWPGADYTKYEYAQGDIVIDNPPFSILSKVVDWYLANNVDFFLFAPGLSCSSYLWRENVTAYVAKGAITYENGAQVPAGFVTNLTPELCLVADGDLTEAIKKANSERPQNTQRKILHPHHIISAALARAYAVKGERYAVRRKEAVFVRKLDNAKQGVFGGGLLLSERAAAERAAAERAAAGRVAAERVQLSERELAIVTSLG